MANQRRRWAGGSAYPTNHRYAGRWWVVLLVVLTASAQVRPTIQEALTALGRGDFASAEQTLRADLLGHPGDSSTLTLLGVALDNQRKFAEADEMHRRAVTSAPQSVDALSNYANHLLNTGKEDEARKFYLQVVGLDPEQLNANLQLARIDVRQKNGREALARLKSVPDSPQVAVVRLEALDAAGDRSGADALATQIATDAGDSLGPNFAIGLELANAGAYARAEVFFSKALAAAPTDINVLVNLGVVAAHAGHYERAREVLQAASRQQPQNVDVLYNLALVDSESRQTEAAVRALAQAARLAPQRADIQRLLAITTGDLGALEDSAAAWERYLKLTPGDDFARRERGFTAIQMGKFEQGMPDLEWFVEKHPEDAVGHFELGQAQSKDEPAKGLVHLDRALALKPDFAAAHSFRGSLYYQSGKFDEAVKDLEAAAALRPDDAVTLDRLGQSYSALDRVSDAVRVLKRAAELAPDDSKTVLHYARALADAGQAAESKVAMDRFRQLGPVTVKSVPGGLVDYLSLTPEQQRADYRSRVEKAARANPKDVAAQVSLLKLQLDEGVAAEETARRIVALKPGAAVLRDAGRALLEAKRYEAARDVLEGTGPDLDLALAVFHTNGAADGLARLEKAPRDGDWYLARAMMTGDYSKVAEWAPTRVDLYREALSGLNSKRDYQTALALLERAPKDRELMLTRATTLELAGRRDEAERRLAELQGRWPEWQAVWVAEGFLLARRGKSAEAKKAAQTAIALGARSTAVRGGSGVELETLIVTMPPREW